MAPQEPNLENRTAMVTGAAGSLGRAIVLGLRDQGCRVIALDQDEAALAEMASEPGIGIIVCDLLDPLATERCIGEAWDQHGPISILVNAIGYIHSAPLVNVAARTDRRHSLETWRRVIDLNLTAVFSATVNVVDRMVSTRTRGVVINFSSVAAAGNAGQGAYSAAKAGVNAMTKAWAKELGILGIRFVAIAPGFIDTPSTRAALPEPILKEWVKRTPLRRLGSVEDVISAIVFAITNEHLTGKVIEIDGGLSL
jgi:3-oxoacyl-[acyl-carrier protein] reductase